MTTSCKLTLVFLAACCAGLAGASAACSPSGDQTACPVDEEQTDSQALLQAQVNLDAKADEQPELVDQETAASEDEEEEEEEDGQELVRSPRRRQPAATGAPVLFYIRQKVNNRYLTDNGSGSVHNVKTGSKSSALKFTFEVNGVSSVRPVEYRIKAEGKTWPYLDAHQSTTGGVVLRARQEDSTHIWILNGVGDGFYTIQQKSNYQFLDAHEQGSFGAVMRDPQNNDSQKWKIEAV